MTSRQGVPAGTFSDWLRRTRAALVGGGGVDVPCGECTACCTSSYFIHVGPGETQALARIPDELLFAAPDLPKGNLVMGYDEKGRCPMLSGEACSIYEHRPLTCRTYDCRVFAAAGIAADRPLIERRARCWAFDYPTGADRGQHESVLTAAKFLQQHPECCCGGALPASPAQVALLAIKVGDVFLERDDSGEAGGAAADFDIFAAVREAGEKFATGCQTLQIDPGAFPGKISNVRSSTVPDPARVSDRHSRWRKA